jgi:hypothetical protein
MGYNTAEIIKSQPTFQRHMPPSSSRSKLVLFDNFLMQIYCLAYYFVLNTEAKCCSETSVDFNQNSRRYAPDNRILDIN